MLTDRFYEELPELLGFEDIFSTGNYMDAPADWMIVVTDVVNSTTAITEGKYKQVNIAGAVAIAVAGNIVGHLRFPFTFGGDGVTAVLPPETAERTLAALADLRHTIRESFSLELRVGALPVSQVTAASYPVRIAKLRVSDKYTQAVFDGAGIAHAEDLIKGGKVPALEDRPNGTRARASTEGFSCRWRKIPSDPGEVAALIVEARESSPERRAWAVREVFYAIRDSLGGEERYHPVAAGRQELISRLDEIDHEARIHARTTGGTRIVIQRMWVRVQLAAVRLAVRWNLPLRYHHKSLNHIPQDNVNHADFRKYDGRLKMVLACSETGRRALQYRLNELEARGAIAYGLHITDHSLITCVMHLQAPDEVHFIDGGDGGYALAAAQLKQKLAAGLPFSPDDSARRHSKRE